MSDEEESTKGEPTEADQAADQSNDDDAAESVEESAKEPADEVKDSEESEEGSAGTVTVNNVINSAGNSESVITYKSVDAVDAAKGADTATIEWKQGCVNGDKLVNGKDLLFTVAPVAGRTVTKVEITIDGTKKLTPTANAASGIYKVENGEFSKKETVDGQETTKALSAEITITTAAQTYTVTFADADGALTGSYEIWTVTEKEADDAKVKVLDTKVTDSVASAVYDTAVEYAVVIPGTANKFVEITVNGDKVTTTESSLNKKNDADETPKTTCYTFSLKPSDYVAIGDTGFTVKVKAVKKAELTAVFAAGDTFTVAAPTTTEENDISYVPGSKNFGTPIVEKADGLADKQLAFKVTPVAGYKITGVTAEAVIGTAAPTSLTVKRGDADEATGAEEDTIALAPVKDFEADTTITITVTTDYSDDPSVHAISFKAPTGKTLDHVDIALTDGTDPVAIKDNAAKVIGNTAEVTVTPDPGYEFAKATDDDVKDYGLAKDDPYITIIKHKTYPAVTTDPAMPEATGTEESKVKVTFDANGDAEAVTVDLTAGTDAKYDGAASDATDRAYNVTSVEVEIDASLMKNTEEKIVKFENGLEDDYNITTEGVINDETALDEKNTWVIPEGVDELEFTVTTTSIPEVECDAFEDEILPVSAEGGVYKYAIPTSVMNAKATTIINISEAEVDTHDVNVTVDNVSNVKSVLVESDGDTVAKYDFDGKTPVNGSYKVTANAVEGKELVLHFTPADGAKITKLSYTMGEGEEAAAGEGTVEADGTASLTIDAVKADVAVSVESVSDYTVVLGGTGITGENGVYKADYTAKDITVTLVKTGTVYNKRFYDIIVKDGNDVAATDAVLAENGQSATIAKIAKDEYGKTLTIEVYTDKGKDPYTATLETTAYSEAVTVTRVDTGKVVRETDTVGIMADSAMEFTVTPAKGATLDDLAVEILSAKENATAQDNTDAAALLAGVPAIDEDGKLILTAKPAAEAKGQVLVNIYNTNEEADKDGKKPHKSMTGGKFTVDLTDPLVKTDEIKKVTATVASATNRTVRVNLNVEFKNKKNPPAQPIAGALYYKVEVEAPTDAPAGVTPIAKYTEYVEIEDFNNPAVTLPIDLVVKSDEDKEGIEADIAAVITSSAKVSLVQSLSSKNLATATTVDDTNDYVAGAESLAATAALATKLPVYETKLSVKAVNSATVFTGQDDAKVATPTFTKETSYDSIYVQFVNSKTGKLLGSSSEEEGMATDERESAYAWVAEDNSIHVGMDSYIYINEDATATDYYKNLGVKVTAVGPDDSYRASAVVKLKVQQGIVDIAFDESKATLPKTLFKESDKKAASVKMTVKLNYGTKEYKPAKSTVAWSVAPEDGEYASAYEKAAVEGKKPLVSVKNGTLTVSKDYRIQDTVNGDTFTVTVKAADYVRTSEYDYTAEISRDFTITSVKNTIAKVVLLDGENNILSTPLSAETFDEPVYVAAVSSTAKEPKKGQTYSNDDFLPVTFKSSAKAAVDVEQDIDYWGERISNKGRLIFHKPGTKIKISASTVDGGKVQKMDTAPFDVNGYNTLGLWLKDTDNVSNDPGTTALSYAGGSNQKYRLYLAHKNGDEWEEDDAYKSVKVAVKGGKFIANKNWAKNVDYDTNWLGDVIVVSDLKTGKAEITLTDTATKDPTTKKNKTYTYTITNTNNKIADKAPSIKLIDPKKPAAGSGQTLTWQITAKDKNNYAGSYVLLAPDYSVASGNYASYSYFVGNGMIRKIDENGQFTLENRTLYSGESYKMIATVGTLVGGNFTTTVKDAKISLSVPKAKKQNENLAVTASYSLDPQSAAVAKIVVKTDLEYTVSDAMNVIKKAKDQGKDVHTNDFTTYFEVKRYNNGNASTWLNNSNEHYAYIGLKDTLTAKQVAEIMDKAKKDDCTGYITVDNGVYRKDVQIKISFKTLKYTATGASVFASTSAVTPVVQVMNGKVPVKAAFAKLDPASDTTFAKEAAATEDGTIAITSQATTTAGKYDVKLLVVPEDSRYIRKNATTGAWERIDSEKTETATTALSDDDFWSLAVPVTAKIEVKALDTKKVVNIKSTNVTLNTGLYTAANGNGYQLGEAGKTGNYVVDIPYTFVAGNTAIGANATDVAVKLEDKDGKNLNEIGADKELLVKASKQSVTVDEETKDVIRLEVSKKALVELSKMDAKAKPITAYGKKLAVPVVLKYTNGVNEETVKFNITMPKKAPKEFSEVVNDVKAAELNKTQSGNKTDAVGILNELVAKVVKKAEALIAADTDVIVGEDPLVKKDWGEATDPAPEVSDAAADVIDSGTAKITLTLTNNAETDAAKKTESVEVACTFDIKHSQGDVATVATAIRTAITNESIEVDNNTTKDSLREAIKEVEVGTKKVGDYLTEGKGNLSLEVSNFVLDEATSRKSGSVTAEIQIKDILVNGYYGKETVEFEATIEKLNDISQIKDAVVEATKKAVLDQIVADCSGQEDLIRKAVLKAAEKAAEGNPDITVDFAEFKFVKAEAKVEAGDGVEAKDEVLGQVSYTLVVKNTVTGRTMKCAEVKSATWTAADAATKYKSVTEAAELVKAAIFDTDGKVKANLIGESNDGDDIQTAIENAANGALTGVDGYQCEWKKLNEKDVDFNYTPADSKNDGKLKFTLVVKSKNEYAAAETAGNAEVTLAETEVLTAAPKYQSVAELKTAIEGMPKTIEVAENVAKANDSNAAKTAIETAVGELVTNNSLSPVVSLTQNDEDDSKNSKWTPVSDENETATLTNVTITIDEKTSVIADFTFTVEAEE